MNIWRRFYLKDTVTNVISMLYPAQDSPKDHESVIDNFVKKMPPMFKNDDQYRSRVSKILNSLMDISIDEIALEIENYPTIHAFVDLQHHGEPDDYCSREAYMDAMEFHRVIFYKSGYFLEPSMAVDLFGINNNPWGLAIIEKQTILSLWNDLYQDALFKSGLDHYVMNTALAKYLEKKRVIARSLDQEGLFVDVVKLILAF